MNRRADDFQIHYFWAEGTVPPPDHYEISITIGPELQGTYTLLPNYHNFHPPTWTERFPVSQAKLDELFQSVRDLGLLDQETGKPTSDSDMVGGESEWIRITNQGNESYISPSANGSSHLKSVHAKLIGLVPDLSKSKLDTAMQRYREERQELVGSIVTSQDIDKVQPFIYDWWTETLSVGKYKKGWDLKKESTNLNDQERAAIISEIERFTSLSVETVRLGEYWCSEQGHWVEALGDAWSVGVCMSCSMDMGSELMEHYKDKG